MTWAKISNSLLLLLLLLFAVVKEAEEGDLGVSLLLPAWSRPKSKQLTNKTSRQAARPPSWKYP